MNRYLASLAIVFLASAVCRAQEWESIFNGKDLTGWEGTAHWSAKDGIISGTITKDTLIKTNTFLVWKGDPVANFEMKCKFRMEGGNSGIQYRSVYDAKNKAPYVVYGYQADMAVSSYTGILYEEGPNRRGIIAQVGQKVVIDPKGQKKVVGSLGENILRDFDITKWHEYLIVAKETISAAVHRRQKRDDRRRDRSRLEGPSAWKGSSPCRSTSAARCWCSSRSSCRSGCRRGGHHRSVTRRFPASTVARAGGWTSQNGGGRNA